MSENREEEGLDDVLIHFAKTKKVTSVCKTTVHFKRQTNRMLPTVS